MTRENERYIIRPGRASDATALAGLHASVQLQTVTGGQPHPGIAAWVEDLLDGHPSAHPAYLKRPRGWYARTGDPADLLTRLLPLLRNRWRAADLRWHEPALTIDMYSRAARLEFTDGQPTTVTAIRGAVSPSTDPHTHAAIPPGACSNSPSATAPLPEVLDTWPDCLLRDSHTEHFLTTAFP